MSALKDKQIIYWKRLFEEVGLKLNQKDERIKELKQLLREVLNTTDRHGLIYENFINVRKDIVKRVRI